ncbi:hypothetical protein FI667_g2010, partial [Globisporangium splendens]
MEANGAINASREALSVTAATMHKRRKHHPLHQAQIHRNVVRALSQRETRGGCAMALRKQQRQLLSSMLRTQWHLSSVLHRDEVLVLLGFSSDGNFLCMYAFCVVLHGVDAADPIHRSCVSLVPQVYYSWWGSCYELQWKRVNFSSRSGRFVSHDPVFRLPVGDAGAFTEQGDHISSSSSLANGMGSSLKVWQSRDHALIVAIATDRHLASQELSLTQSFHVSIAPAPGFDGGAAVVASDITSLRFVYTVSSPCQDMETWQLLHFDAIATTSSAKTYHLVINMGTSVMILGVHLHTQRHTTSSLKDGEVDRFPGFRVSMLMQSMICTTIFCWQISLQLDAYVAGDVVLTAAIVDAWYFPPEFPIEFQREVFRRRVRAPGDTSSSITVQCVWQQTFDVERFLQSFLNSYGSLRQLNLVDYDLQLVRASEVEKTLFMSCVMELESSLSSLQVFSPSHGQQPQRFMHMALFFSLHLVTGKYDIIRALRPPRQQQNLRHLSRMLAKKYQHDVDTRIPPPEHTAAVWDNTPAMQEQSLKCVHNPQFPISIYLN